MVKVGIFGATGYTGVELIRILSKHEKVEIKYLSSQSYNTIAISDVYSSLLGFCDRVLEEVDFERAMSECDVIFTALPSGHASKIAREAVKKGIKVIDLGADFRFDDYSIYKEWYSGEYDGYDGIKRVYGLPEIYRDDIKEAQVVGNPGCYPTSVILGLMPLLKNGIIEGKIIVDSKSGVSGAGRSPSQNNIYAECNENIKAYNVAKHRHIPEMEQELSKIFGERVSVVFTPYLAPMTRGILSTMYCKLKKDIDVNTVYDIYADFYKKEYFIKVLKPGHYPATKSVYGSNFCHIGFEVDKRTNTLIVMSAIDNLVKGASGQAVQNMNIMFGIQENTALDIIPIYP
ncbi:N-acetyl-gamma-glutamyl-phosphate reductase [Thermoanaerobacter italicus Ab9]|uniref:N-acetyl-gamma-glutamyl-phosphate reductase n=1 Tax=Thermoanaerobacter italicus (strain DSM 9252 / Ab9) TaxID=580331 RepID=D3T5L4_THEIA|nr:N-acetyl-gamma-glutamyl-phosphate reductase [Thermoanaerobacter italicus]ADD03387.1 N-acetyl-gamma-glutamyl-phosphate reductase [Thermoanaerobacter italicus Ab9]